MKNDIVRITVLLSVFVLLAFVVFVVNQTAQVVQLAEQVHPKFGEGVFWALIFLYAALLLTPLILFLRLPRQLRPPSSRDEPGFEAYIAALRKRLSQNPQLAGVPLTTQLQVEAAIEKLDGETNRLVCNAASAVFLSTAISQSGRLDGLMVLSVQSRLIWQVAHVYFQRPAVRDLVQLYANVAGTAFIAGELDDIDVEPIVGSVFGSVVSAVPGVQLFVSSVLSGATNAFLTLRIGMIAKRYCNCLVLEDRKVIRRSATGEATKLIGIVVRDGTVRLTKAAVALPRSKLKQWTENMRWPWPGKTEET